MLALSAAWIERGDDVTVITFDRVDVPSYPVHPSITQRNLELPAGRSTNMLEALTKNFRRIRKLRRAIRDSKPGIVVSFLDVPNVVTLFATRGLGVPVIVSERGNPELDEITPMWRFLRRWTYPTASALVCQTHPMLQSMLQKINIPGYVIPNPISLPPGHDSIVNRRKDDSPSHTVIGMGRLTRQKGFDLLLEAFSRVAKAHPDWSLKILGVGPLREQLEAQAEALGISERVEFAGVFADPFPILRAGDLFVFSSRFEGFGNALAEAMLCGLPVISFDCPAGPSDIIRHEIDGLLVPAGDVEALASAMDRLMNNPGERERLASRAPEIVSRFSMDKVLTLWDELFRKVLRA